MAKWAEIKCPRCAELETQIAAMEEGLTAVHMAGYMDGQKAADAKLAMAIDFILRLKRFAIQADDKFLIEKSQEVLAELTGGKQ